MGCVGIQRAFRKDVGRGDPSPAQAFAFVDADGACEQV